MDKEILNERKQQLHKEEQRILEELEQIRDGEDADGVTFPQYGSKDDENAAEIATFSTNVSVADALEKALKDVRSALQRIEDGTYGICKYCKTPIPEKRLTVRPESSSCISCKEALKQS